MGRSTNTAEGLVAVIFVAIIVSTVIFVIAAPLVAPNDSTTAQEPNKSQQTEDEIREFIQDYRGKDDSGDPLVKVLANLLVTAYSGENILANPSTTSHFTVLPKYHDGYWNIEFYMKTYRETVSYQWAVDMKTKSVYALNENGKDVLDILDAYN